MSASTNLDQTRAAFAWKKLSDGSLNKDYKNLAKSAPALIMNNGLMQTLAYLEDKGKEAGILRVHISEWLQEQDRHLIESSDFASVMMALHQSNSQTYRWATDETLKFLRWVRQFASTNLKES